MRAKLVLAVGVLLTGAVPADAKPEPRELGPLPSKVVSDGARYAAWTDDDFVRVRDTVDGGSHLVASPGNCQFVVVGAGELLFECPAGPGPDGCGRTAPLLYSLGDRAFHWPVGTSDVVSSQDYRDAHSNCRAVDYRAVGRHWIKYVIGSYDAQLAYLNWRSGESGYPHETETTVVDLDAADLVSAICAPLRRAPNPFYDADDVYGPGRYYEQPVRGDFSVHAVGRGQNGFYRKLYLERCGSGERLRVTRIARVWGMTRRVVWWEEWDFLHVHVLRSGRRFRYRLPDDFFGDLEYSIATTNTRLFAWHDETSPAYVIRTPKR